MERCLFSYLAVTSSKNKSDRGENMKRVYKEHNIQSIY